MRKIAFRAWDKSRKVMRYNVHPFIPNHAKQMFETSLVELNQPKDKVLQAQVVFEEPLPGFEVMQFTGLHDKHGKEIYEGDVVRYQVSKEHELYPYTAVIAWLEKEACFGLVDYSTDNPAEPDYPILGWGVVEILGNIYEQPELVK